MKGERLEGDCGIQIDRLATGEAMAGDPVRQVVACLRPEAADDDGEQHATQRGEDRGDEEAGPRRHRAIRNG
jgi:hypothetical protein